MTFQESHFPVLSSPVVTVYAWPQKELSPKPVTTGPYMATSRKVYETTSTVTDLRTGEAVKHTSSNVVRISEEPAYVKMYVQDLGNLMALTGGQKNLLYALAGKIGFDGIISLNAASRRRLAKACGLSDGAFRNAMSTLCKKQILRRIESNEYEVNPHYFAKGEWRAISQRRQDFELRIRYTADGRREVSTEGRDPETPQESLDF